MADKMKGMGGLSKLGGSEMERKPKPESMSKGKDDVSGEPDETGTKTHTIEEHPDGHLETHMHDGTAETHPDHLHMLAHIGHHLTGGDKHHVAHHDGMAIHTHGIHESGEHDGPHEHNTAEEAKESLGKFFDEEAQEPAHQGGEGAEAMPAYGGMGA